MNAEEHLQKAREQLNGAIACWEHEEGNKPNVLQFICLAYEHGLKSLYAYDKGTSETPRGHDLHALMSSISFNVPDQNLTSRLNDTYTRVRYENMGQLPIYDFEKAIEQVGTFLGYVSNEIDANK